MGGWHHGGFFRDTEERAGAEENDYSHVVTADQNYVKDQVVV